MIRGILRGAAVAIAIAAAIDPALTISARGRSRIAIVVPDPHVDGVAAAADRLAALLRSDFDVTRGADAAARAVVAIGADAAEPPLPESGRIYTVTIAQPDRARGVRVSAVRAPRQVPSGTLIHLECDIDGTDVAGVTSTLTIRAAASSVDVGRATHTWSAARERWRAVLDVTPLGPPPWHLRADVSSPPRERLLFDNAADVLVAAADPIRVLVYEPRPSWAVTFVRRALERDARFDVASLSVPSRGVSVTAGTGVSQPLTRTTVDAFQAVVAGGLDRVSSTDAGVLTEFMRGREGALVLLPDSRADLQAIGRAMPMPPATEVLLETPARLSVEAPLPSLDASELLTFGAAAAAAPIATTDAHAPVIVIQPAGAGRMLLSGALDAWRHRANAAGAFDRFWQAAIAGVAAASPPRVDIRLVPPVVTPGATVDVRVRVRGGAATISAASDGNPVRLWPNAAPGTFRGSFVAPSSPGAVRVVVTAGDVAGTATFMVAAHAREARPAGPPLSLLASTHGGIDVGDDDLPTLARRLHQDLVGPLAPATRRPMRSVWWIVPFAACLGGEWWLRRVRGLR